MKTNDLILKLQKIHVEFVDPRNHCECSICKLIQELALEDLLDSTRIKEMAETVRRI